MAITIQAYGRVQPPKVAAMGRRDCGTVAPQPLLGRADERGGARSPLVVRDPPGGLGVLCPPRRAARPSSDEAADDSLAAAIDWLRGNDAHNGGMETVLAGLRINPVLTAHPTEARRRTVLIALRRIERLLARLADREIVATEDL